MSSDIGHPEEDGEVRTFEKILLSEHSRRSSRAVRMHLDRVDLFAEDNNKVVSRLFIKQSGDAVTCEAFYKDK